MQVGLEARATEKVIEWLNESLTLRETTLEDDISMFVAIHNELNNLSTLETSTFSNHDEKFGTKTNGDNNHTIVETKKNHILMGLIYRVTRKRIVNIALERVHIMRDFLKSLQQSSSSSSENVSQTIFHSLVRDIWNVPSYETPDLTNSSKIGFSDCKVTDGNDANNNDDMKGIESHLGYGDLCKYLNQISSLHK